MDVKEDLNDRVSFTSTEERFGHDLRVGITSKVAIRKASDSNLFVFSHIREKEISDVSIEDLKRNVFPNEGKVEDIDLNITEPANGLTTLPPSRRATAQAITNEIHDRASQGHSFNQRVKTLEGDDVLRHDNFLGASLTGDNDNPFISSIGGGWHRKLGTSSPIAAKGTATNAIIDPRVVFIGHQAIYTTEVVGDDLLVYVNGKEYEYTKGNTGFVLGVSYERYFRQGTEEPPALITGHRWNDVHIVVKENGEVLLESARKFLTSVQKSNIQKLENIYQEKTPSYPVNKQLTIESFKLQRTIDVLPAAGYFRQAKHKGWLVRVYQDGHVFATRNGRDYFDFGKVPFQLTGWNDFAIESTDEYLVLSGGGGLAFGEVPGLNIYRTQDLRSWENTNQDGENPNIRFGAVKRHNMIYLRKYRELHSVFGINSEGERVIAHHVSTDSASSMQVIEDLTDDQKRIYPAILKNEDSFIAYGGQEGTNILNDAWRFDPVNGLSLIHI